MIAFELDGRAVEVPDSGGSLLQALREDLGCRVPKDGCSPQGQCGCCTVLIDGAPRVSCVTPARRVAGRAVTTAEGLPAPVRDRWARAFADAGASQCGFCTPGIVVRLAALDPEAVDRPGFSSRRRPVDRAAVRTALLAHLCRCTGWQSVVEAAADVLGVEGDEAAPRDAGPPESGPPESGPRDPLLAEWRAQVEGPAFQHSGPRTVLGGGGFADDTAPDGALVVVPGPDGEPVVAATLAEAQRRAGKVQGRNSTVPLVHPVEVPPGDWALTLRTTWIEPAYLEPDASWCGPGGVPATPLANGGAFGGKRSTPVPAQARRLADEHGRAVRVLWSREDVVRRGPKRPPLAAGLREDGTGVLRFARGVGTVPGAGAVPGRRELADVLAARVAAVAPGLVVEVVDVPGPPTSADLRGSGWVEAAVLTAALGARSRGGGGPGTPVEVTAPSGGRARVTVTADGPVEVEVWAGEVLDRVTLRSYCLGAVHQALGWVRSEGIAVGPDGGVHDLTIRSFGILSARETPHVEVTVHRAEGWPVNGSDAVFAATAAAAWLADDLAPQWPTRRDGGGTRPAAPAAPAVAVAPVTPLAPGGSA